GSCSLNVNMSYGTISETQNLFRNWHPYNSHRHHISEKAANLASKLLTFFSDTTLAKSP
ncbi:12294_t:CDS:1, partial [Racocetra fulgida]